METSRMRYLRKRKKSSGAGGFIRAAVIALVFGAALYLIFGTGVLKRVKDNWSLSLLDRILGKGSPSPTLSSEGPASPVPTPAPTGETAEIKLPAIEIYMLQTGVFESRESAREKAESLRAMGAAGYVYDDSGSFRLIAAAYSDEASAQSVRDRLIAEGVECGIYKVTGKEVGLIVTASPERLLPIRTAFGLVSDISAQLDELAIDFDANARGTDHGLAVLTEIQTNIASAALGLKGMTEQNAMLEKLSVCLNDMSSLVSEAASRSSTRAEFSSSLKTLRIRAALLYRGLLESMGE